MAHQRRQIRDRTKTLLALAVATGWVWLSASPVLAQEPNFANPAAPPPTSAFAAAPSLFGNLFGLRKTLAKLGITIGGIYTGEVFSNVNGGIRTGTVAEGLLELDLDVDLEKFIGLKGGTIHFSVFDPHGTGLSERYTGDLSTVSSIDAYDSFRIAEYWYEQKLFNDKLTVRIGQFLTENEFYYSDYSNLFICGSFGAYAFLVSNFPFAPSYPMSAPAVRFVLNVTSNIDLNVGVYSGSTLAQATNNRSLPNIRAQDGLISFYELDYRVNHEDIATGLPTTYKLGAIYHSLYDGQLNNNLGSANRPGYGLYLTIDQAIWKKPTTDKNVRPPGLGVFCRLGYMPEDFGFVSHYIDGGFNYNGLIPGRNDDIFGIAVTHSGISDSASRRSVRAGGPHYTYETLIEATYTAKVLPWLTLQPDFQYIINPGATDIHHNATVLGIRTTMTF
ncbi:MAG: carbohydrate porin [Verrucomicrobia bacterium]|nr:carbohydrate porin [Verrucomicrobiota bacterium]